ncbi:MAG: hypothetical protein KF799_07135 [Bdellovibrionales bacterium]|nr:hypothetical protein [Bdellovibrionales bacterium]
MSKLTLLTCGLVANLLLNSCAHLKFERGEPSESGSQHAYRVHQFLWGMTKIEKFPAPLCAGSSFKEAYVWMSAQDVLLGLFTLGIYVPHRATVTCSKFRNTKLTLWR